MSTNLLKVGVMATSSKPDERRIALHPDHLRRIPDEALASLYLETGFASDFGMTDDGLREVVAGVLSRADLIEQCDVIVQPKPVLSEVSQLRDGQVLWGWPHCVQDTAMTQVAIDKKLTLIAFEAMNHWSSDDAFQLHVFHKNNELAGYSSVLHATALAGSTGTYGRRLRAAVIGFGATARGAVTALNAIGVHDVDVLTHRDVAAVAAPIHSATIVNFGASDTRTSVSHAATEEGEVPLAEFLADHDIIVNCVLQDPEHPLMFILNDDLALVNPGTIIIDVSCDEGMGFEWAKPTSFRRPTFVVGDNVLYYAVDHSPSYFWNSATWENSEALLPFLETVMGGHETWEADPTIRHAIEIRDGVIQNPAILSFQHRSGDYPHPVV
ncbi:MAG: N(5)-(carboxyethyl)ornithine synthase [Humibacillus sp.]|nr:N(5)-(carboxyethyl)ornithine synthase [Humibacillus sp.]MDN5776216.1 N(5)-(carboxyethyl)ornithine synthase [Humibacillus sp.]